MDGGGRGRDIRDLFTSLPPPLSLFLTVNRPLGTNFFLSPAFRCHYKSKMAAIIFVKMLLGTRSPKLRQLCRLIIFFNNFNVLGKRYANVFRNCVNNQSGFSRISSCRQAPLWNQTVTLPFHSALRCLYVSL